MELTLFNHHKSKYAMSKMKSLAMMMAMSAIALESSKPKPVVQAPTPQPTPPIPKGLKPFKIEGKIVYAINEKNARKKAAKKQK